MSTNRDILGIARAVPRGLLVDRFGDAGRRLQAEWIDEARSADDIGRSRLAAAMLMIRAERPTRPLLAEANARALRWVDRQVRQTRAAEKLRTAAPQLSWRLRIVSPLGTLGLQFAAAAVLLVCRTGVLDAVQSVIRLGTRMAETHFDKHVGPMA